MRRSKLPAVRKGAFTDDAHHFASSAKSASLLVNRRPNLTPSVPNESRGYRTRSASGPPADSQSCACISTPQGSKKEWRSLCGAKPRRALDQNPCARRPPRPGDPDPDHAWSSPRSNRRRTPSGQPWPRHHHYRRQGLRCRSPAGSHQSARRHRQHSQHDPAQKRFRWTKAIYRERNHVERFFNKLKQFRRIATRCDKLGGTFLAFIQLAAVRISLRLIESTA
jgi:transposase